MVAYPCKHQLYYIKVEFTRAKLTQICHSDETGFCFHAALKPNAKRIKTHHLKLTV